MSPSKRAVAPAPLHLKLDHFTNVAGFSAIDITNGGTVIMGTYTPWALTNLSPRELDSLAGLMTAAPQVGQALANVIGLAEAGLKHLTDTNTLDPAAKQDKELQLFDATLLMRRLGIQRACSGI